ncbi:hypothetical protein [Methylobacterium haplocladii]|uniref:hypothetical protein n=1 Tax=Methylobacterium haplocladii TaxID=1176176 RepID=UPI0011BF5E0C|nr:hypothetical protein [Methylobacterium haplocladii]GJD85739.1 hypothetical protein HPGCJGGD_3630 [Methylobacterium haplocladii]
MTDVKTEMSKGDEAAWNAMMDQWRASLAAAAEGNGRMPAASGMLFVALQALRIEVGDQQLAAMLEAVATKVRSGEPLTMKVKG